MGVLASMAARRTPHGVRGLKWAPGRRWLLRYLSHPARGAWIEMCTVGPGGRLLSSHPARGAWIEIQRRRPGTPPDTGRTPHGVRGLKFGQSCVGAWASRSHPARGAWIEIKPDHGGSERFECRTPHGVRGLKSLVSTVLGTYSSRRTPHGVRGLKLENIKTAMEKLRRTPHGVRGLKSDAFN